MAVRREMLMVVSTLLLVVFSAGLQLSTWPVRFRYPGEGAEVEGMCLAEMVRLRRGEPIYAAASEKGLDAAIYGPLYYLIGARLVDPDRPAYFPLRFLATLTTLGCVAMSGWLAFRISRRWLAAALAPLIILSYGIVSLYGTCSRSDSGALFLVLAGVLVAYEFRQSARILFAVPLFILGFFYKQQFVAAPVAVMLFLLFERRFRVAAAFAGIMAAGVVGLLALFQFAIFRGQDFFQHFFRYNLVPFSSQLYMGGFIFFGALLAVPLLVAFESLRLHRERFMACYLSVALLSVLLAVGKEGSNTNYFLECIFVSGALFAALLASRITEGVQRLELISLLGVTLFLALLFAPPPPRALDFIRDRAVQQYLRANFPPRTPALSYYTGDLVRAGLDTPITDIHQYAHLIRAGRLDERPLLTALARHEFKVILLTFDLQAGTDQVCLKRYLTDALAGTIREHYEPVEVLDMPAPQQYHPEDRFYVWVPRPQSLLAAPARDHAAPE